MQTIAHWLAEATATLQAAGIGTARLDAVVLLEDATSQSRAWLLAHPEHDLTNPELSALSAQQNRRANHEPLAYIRGHSEFYGRTFTVNASVLVPRPESEAMIEVLKTLAIRSSLQVSSDSSSPTPLVLADIGTGSGALGITAALECGMPGLARSGAAPFQLHVHDIDPDALAIAAENARRLSAPATCHLGNLLYDSLGQPTGPYDILLANLPYVPNRHQINEAATFEPRLAIFGGDDGLDVYRQLFEQLAGLDWRPQVILTESLPLQHQTLAKIAETQGYNLRCTDDFIQVFEPGPDKPR